MKLLTPRLIDFRVSDCLVIGRISCFRIFLPFAAYLGITVSQIAVVADTVFGFPLPFLSSIVWTLTSGALAS